MRSPSRPASSLGCRHNREHDNCPRRGDVRDLRNLSIKLNILTTNACPLMTQVSSLEKPRNSAARITNVMIRAATQQSALPCSLAWSNAFEISSDSDGLRVTDLLRKLSRELEAAVRALTEQEVPPHLYMYAVNAFKPMLDARNLSQAWGKIASGVAMEHIIAFRWAAYTLPDEAHQVDEADLNELKQLLADFESALNDAILPPALRAYLSDQLATMNAAIAAAVVSGTADIRVAVRKAIADANFNEEQLKSEIGTISPDTENGVGTKFRNLLKKSAEVSGDIDKIAKMTKLASEGVEWLRLQWGQVSSFNP